MCVCVCVCVVRRNTNFSSEAPPDVIMKRLIEILTRLPLAMKVHRRLFKIDIIGRTGSGLLCCTLQIYRLAPDLHMVDMRKCKVRVFVIIGNTFCCFLSPVSSVAHTHRRTPSRLRVMIMSFGVSIAQFISSANLSLKRTERKHSSSLCTKNVIATVNWKNQKTRLQISSN